MFDFHLPDRLREFLRKVTTERLPIPFFSTAENHNTPRAYTRPFPLEFVHYALALSVVLRASVHPQRVRVDGNQAHQHRAELQRRNVARQPDRDAALFSEWAYDWTRKDNLVQSIRYAFGLRKKYDALLSDPDPATAALAMATIRT